MTPSQASGGESFHQLTREPGVRSIMYQRVGDEQGPYFDHLGENSVDASRIFALWEHFLSGPRTDEVN